MSIFVIALLCMMAGCGTNEEELFAQWEQEHREAWEQAAESTGYDRGYEDGRMQGIAEYEEEEKEQQTVKEEREKKEEEKNKKIEEYCLQYDCTPWNEQESFDFTIDLQNKIIGNKYVVECFVDDVYTYQGSNKLRAESFETPDYFCLDVTNDMVEKLRELQYSNCIFIIQVDDVLPLDVIDNYIEYGDLIEDEYLSVGDAVISYNLWTDCRIVTGVCEEIIPLD